MSAIIQGRASSWNEVYAPTDFTGGALSEDVTIDFSGYDEFDIRGRIVLTHPTTNNISTAFLIKFFAGAVEKFVCGGGTFVNNTTNAAIIKNGAALGMYVPSTLNFPTIVATAFRLYIDRRFNNSKPFLNLVGHGLVSTSSNPMATLFSGYLDADIQTITKLTFVDTTWNINENSRLAVYGR